MDELQCRLGHQCGYRGATRWDLRLVVAHQDPGATNWLDTGGRGFITVRWPDNPSTPPAKTRVVPLSTASD